jgi:hypothetical protein
VKAPSREELAVPTFRRCSGLGIGASRPGDRGARVFHPALEELDRRDLPAVLSIAPTQSLAMLEGVPFSGTVATFTDSYIFGPSTTGLANLHASIDWGDGHTSAGSITGPDLSGNLQVIATNTYTEAGLFPMTVTITDGNDHTSSSAVATVSVKATGVSPFRVTAQDIAANAGEAFSGLVATIQDPNPHIVPGKLLVRIGWGDGTVTTNAPVSGPNALGLFEVRTAHTYAKAGSYTLTVSVLDSNTNQWATVTGSATVMDNPGTFSLSGVDVAATAGVPFTHVIGILHDSDPNAAAGNLTATISWGDGTALDTGRVVASDTPEFFQIIGTHAYGHAGADSIHIWVHDSANAHATDALANASIAAVTAGTLSVTGVGVTTSAGQSFSQVVGVIQDTNANASLSTLSATISWGDGSSVQTVSLSPAGPAGLFQLVAGHTYASAGSDQITIWVNDSSNGQSAMGTTTATVSPAVVVPPPPAPSPPPPAAPLVIPAPVPIFTVLFRWHHHGHALRHVPHFAAFLTGLRPF